MCIIFLIMIVISIFTSKKYSCSLLSRLKNRYEYVSQGNNVDLFTEDLYNFEFTIDDRTTIKSTSTNSFNEIDGARKEFYITLQSSIINLTETYRRRTDALPGFHNIYDRIPFVPAEPFFLSRPVIETSSSKPRKTWPTYFLRKTLPQKLETGKSATTKTNVTSKNIERNFPHHGITLITASPPNNPTPSTSSSTMNTLAPSSILTPLSTLENSTITSNTSATATTPTTTMKNKNMKISYCYRCGLNESGIPSAYCYNSFEGSDRSYGRKHLFEIKCVRDERVREDKKIAYGPLYRKGCFKRFLDVGIVYNERGCRTIVPTRGKSYASKRFASMEYLLKDVNDGCVFSPHSSITPFSRTISLFARYHVCVCSQKYCNRADPIKQNLIELFILIIIYKRQGCRRKDNCLDIQTGRRQWASVSFSEFD
ncbi:uncharacterized protein LOC123880481 [Maniola jurtina]|uniref:uncharacterized protein LOC123880481 n=1 Tax=Maniola jurtina TaxID=191418 RepID=UPI001E6891D2|nr:uncharacterized protein LOC123880481 [Maniola jurtina]